MSSRSCVEKGEDEGNVLEGSSGRIVNKSYWKEDEDEGDTLERFAIPTTSVDWLSLAEDPAPPHEDGSFTSDDLSNMEQIEGHISSKPIQDHCYMSQHGEIREDVVQCRAHGESQACPEHTTSSFFECPRPGVTEDSVEQGMLGASHAGSGCNRAPDVATAVCLGSNTEDTSDDMRRQYSWAPQCAADTIDRNHHLHGNPARQ